MDSSRVVAGVGEQRGQRPGEIDVIIHHENAISAPWRVCGRGRQINGDFRFDRGQAQDKFAPLPLPFALGGYRAAVHFGERLDHGEPDAEAAFRSGQRAVSLSEELEDVWQELRADPLPLIAHADHDFAILALRTEPDVAAFFGILNRVCEQIGDDSAESGWGRH